MSSRKRHGRHRLKQTGKTNIKCKRVLSATAATLAATGALQILNATDSSADVNPWNIYLQPSGAKQTPEIYYSMDRSIDPTTRNAIDRAVKIWNTNTSVGGNNLLRSAEPGQNATLVFGRRYLGNTSQQGKILRLATLNNCYGSACRQGDIAFDPSLFDGRPQAANSPQFSTQVSVAVHEIGHALGLWHSAGGTDIYNPGNPDEIMRPIIPHDAPQVPSGAELATVRNRYYPQSVQRGDENRQPVPTERKGQPVPTDRTQYRQTQFYSQAQDGSWHSFTPGSSTNGYTNFVGYGLGKNGVWQEIGDPRNYLRGIGEGQTARAEAESQRTDQERADQQRTDQEKADQQRTDQERADQQRTDQEKADQQRTDQERADQQRTDQEKADQQRTDQERAEYRG
ncbi:matrixin family metalloprotease [Streptomyces sp. AK02-04a]|uniref:matrixin family metalloprotease n=1 Tax=Streptomyces sp. AK02-04a TaxID=3028649 RepID=UPI0029AD2E44|nr:matrixin family metalloprotease [Streptomyces sp. AK02-04a]MDX3763025.1 matrixin family metalloprotease [Streptomyces sp. AK02-04a]